MREDGKRYPLVMLAVAVMMHLVNVRKVQVSNGNSVSRTRARIRGARVAMTSEVGSVSLLKKKLVWAARHIYVRTICNFNI